MLTLGNVAGASNLRAIATLKQFDSAALATGASLMGLAAKFAALGVAIAAAFGSVREAAKFEDAFAQVKKVMTDETPEAIARVRKELLDLSTTIPVTAVELAKIAQIGGQMGVPAEAITQFTGTVARLGVTAEMSSEQVAMSLAKIATVTGVQTDEFGKLGSSLVYVADRYNATAEEVLRMSRRMSGSAAQAKVTAPEIFGLATALASVGVNAEAGGGAMTTFFTRMSTAVEQGGRSLQLMAQFASKARDDIKDAMDFKRVFQTEGAMAAFQALIDGMSKVQGSGKNLLPLMKDLGVTSIRLQQSILGLSGAKGLLSRAVADANKGFANENILIEKAAIVFDTFNKQWDILGNKIRRVAIDIGTEFLPSLTAAMKKIGEFVDASSRIVKVGIDVKNGLTDQQKSAFVWAAGLTLGAQLVFAHFGKLVLGANAAMNAITAFGAATFVGTQGVMAFSMGLATAAIAAPLLGIAIFQIGQHLMTTTEWGNKATDSIAEFINILTGAGDAAQLLDITLGGLGGSQGLSHSDFAVWFRAQSKRNVKAAGRGSKGAGEEPEDEITQAASRAVQMAQKAIRDELDKTRDASRSAYGQMAADIDRTIEKHLIEARTIKGISEQDLAALAAGWRRVGEAQKDAAASKALEAVLGPAIGEAATKWKTLADNIADAHKRGIQPTNEQIKAGIPLWKEWKSNALGVADDFKRNFPEQAKVLEALFEQVEKISHEFLTLRDISADAIQVPDDVVRGAEVLAKNFEDAVKAREKEVKAAIEQAAKEKAVNAEVLARLSLLKWTDEEWKQIKETLTGVDGKTDDVVKKTFDWSKALSLVSDIFRILGIEANSTLGRILTSLTAIVGVYKTMHDAKGNRRGFGSLSDDEQMQVVGAGFGVAGNIYNQSKEERNPHKRIASGGVQGSMFGFAVGGPAGAVIGGIAGSLLGYFSGPAWESTARIAGQTLGFEVSNELAKKIHDTKFEFGVDARNAALLNLPAAMAESGKEARTFGANIAELMKAVADGSVPAAAGIKVIGQSFSEVAQAAAEAGIVGDATMVALIKGARELGLQVPEITAHVQASLQKAIDAMGALVGLDLKAGTDPKRAEQFGFSVATTEGNARDQAAIFSDVFWASIEEFGIAHAIDSMKEPFETLRQSITEAFGAEFADEILGPMQGMFEVFTEGPARDALNGVEALRGTLIGLADSGYLTTSTFEALQRQAVNAFQSMTDGGATTEQAIGAMVPMIQAAITAAEQLGVPLSEDMQRLKELAEQNGYTFRTDPMQAMVDILKAIAKVLGADIPDAARKTSDAIRSIPRPPRFDDGGTGDDDPNKGADQSNALGFFTPSLPKDTLIQAHQGESVSIVPGGSASGGGGNTAALTAALMALRDEQRSFNRALPKVIRDAVVMASS